MSGETKLPETISVEVKLTTSTAVTISAREMTALRTRDAHALGLIAALFWCGDRRVDGRWLVVDAREIVGPSSHRSLRISKEALVRTMDHQPGLNRVKAHLERYWKPFLRVFFEEAIEGREMLREELARRHDEGTFERLREEEVLESEHLDAVAKLIRHHGEKSAGHIFQVFFAYLLAHAGYRNVTINRSGVPDIKVSHLYR